MSTPNTSSHQSRGGKYLTFSISKENYGIEILKVQEIIKVTQITPVPRCPEFIKGVINLRGKIIPVIDLRVRFGIEPIPYDDKTCIIVITVGGMEQSISIGVIVDTVLEVIDFAAADIEPPPNYGVALESNFILGMGKKDDQLNILVDIERILTSIESTQLREVAVQQPH